MVTNNNRIRFFAIAALVVCVATGLCRAQSSAFTFQGIVTSNGAAETGSYQFEFRLFDAVAGGNQIGQTNSLSNVLVTNGQFNAVLDFGAGAFTGSERYLEISVRKNSSNPFTVLQPRQRVLSTPYSIKSKTSDSSTTADNALSLGGLDSSRFVSKDQNGNVSVTGVIQSTTGGFKFPDSTVQTTAALTSVATASPLTGIGTANSPITIASDATFRDADNPARNPVQFQFRISNNGTFQNLTTLPAGKRLVIEFISFGPDTTGPSAVSLTYLGIKTTVNGTEAVYYFFPVMGTPAASWSCRIYADPNSVIKGLTSVTTSNTFDAISISGYYVNVP
jgi:hypothetical protein